MDVIVHVEHEQRVVEEMLLWRLILVDFSGCRCYQLILLLKCALLDLNIWLARRKIALLTENGCLKKKKKKDYFSEFQNSKTHVSP